MGTSSSNRCTGRGDAPQNASSGDQLTAECGLIEVHIRELRQLFDSLDPAPFHEKDLDRTAEEYIVESLKELPSRAASALVIYLDQPAGVADEGRVVGEAIRVYFGRRAQLLRRQLRQLLRRGLVSLGIGSAVLSTFVVLGQVIGRLMDESALSPLLKESLLIGGWVAMWRPLEIFLYDWWPIVGERRIYDRLSRIKVRIIYTGAESTDISDTRVGARN